MTDGDIIADLEADRVVKGPACSVGLVLQDPAWADQMRSALDPKYPAASVARVFRRRGVTVAAEAVSRHRRDMCSCAARGIR